MYDFKKLREHAGTNFEGLDILIDTCKEQEKEGKDEKEILLEVLNKIGG